MSDGMGREPAYLSSHATNRYFIPNWGNPYIADGEALKGFASGNNRINADVDITLLSAGFKAWGGYNTISLDARTNVGL